MTDIIRLHKLLFVQLFVFSVYVQRELDYAKIRQNFKEKKK